MFSRTTKKSMFFSGRLNESTSTITVGAGELKSVQFQFDLAAKFTMKYADDYGDPVVLPTPIPVTAASTYGLFNLSGSPLSLHPFPSGYQFLAGIYKPLLPEVTNSGCLSPDPDQWPDAPDGAVGQRAEIYTAAPGGTIITPVDMGVVRISLNGTRMVRAVSVANNSGTGDPGCLEGYTVTFPNKSGTIDIALPFGTWEIQTKSTGSGSWSAIKTNGSDKLIEVRTRGAIDNTKVLLDPRKVP